MLRIVESRKVSESLKKKAQARGSAVKNVAKFAARYKNIFMILGVIGYLLSPIYERYASEVMYPIVIEWIKEQPNLW